MRPWCGTILECGLLRFVIVQSTGLARAGQGRRWLSTALTQVR